MSLHDSFFDANLRVTLRNQLIASGTPTEFAGTIADVACHAAQQALDTLDRTVWQYPDQRIGITAMGPALSLCLHRLTETLQALKASSAACGLPCHEATLQVRP